MMLPTPANLYNWLVCETRLLEFFLFWKLMHDIGGLFNSLSNLNLKLAKHKNIFVRYLKETQLTF